jgi:hypothetical protein
MSGNFILYNIPIMTLFPTLEPSSFSPPLHNLPFPNINHALFSQH